MKPILGINADVKSDPEPSLRIKLEYVDAVRRAGGIPVVLPACEPADLPALLAGLDGLVLSGGGDIDVRERGVALHPAAELMKPRRQAFDRALAQHVLARPMPTLGICLGMQMLAWEEGAPLLQHLPDAGIPGVLDHRANHAVAIEAGSRLAALVGTRLKKVVSHHHQGIGQVPARFRKVATAPDGVVEAFEDPRHAFFLGVQWHPERDPEAEATHRIFRALVEAAAASKRRAAGACAP